ncbi:hypothetical protein WMW72_22530 [Paenibacillus filicis]|uniref:Uncharacterized protein n=1 Tax=Paenibacillus filicis TaxID=669464 RepID=A0ABU9DP88_9BACL
MLFRIYWEDRSIPVNLPENSYSEAWLESLSDQLIHTLNSLFPQEDHDASHLEMIDLELSTDGWQPTLYLGNRTERLSRFFLV